MLKDEIEIVKSFFCSKINKSFLNPKKVFSFFLSIIMWTLRYIHLLRSEAYAFAKNYTKGSKKIVEELGVIQSMRPSFANFKVSYGAGVWTAKFRVVINGDKRGVAYLYLTNSANSWVVNEANMITEDGSAITLIGIVPRCAKKIRKQWKI